MAESAVKQAPAPSSGNPPLEFRRDRLTWLVYLLYGSWCLAWGLFGPIMPFLRAELGINYGQAALHFSALALGVFIAGIVGHKVIQVLGLAGTITVGVSAIIIGIICVLLGGTATVTIGGALLAGSGGSYLGQATVAALNKRFGEQRGQAIAELNVTGSIFAAIAPMTVAALIGLGASWKAAFVAPLALIAGLLLTLRVVDVGSLTLPAVDRGSATRLPAAYWMYFVVIFLSVAGEWSVGFWCPEFLEKVVHASRVDACHGLTVFMIAMLVGRVAGTRLIAAMNPRWLLSCSALAAACGFLLFWLSTNMLGCLVGLAILGLGEANVYPLALSAAIGAAGSNGTRAASRMSLSTGAAILLAPLVLGMMADSLGLFWAHAVASGLFVFAAIVTIGLQEKFAPALSNSQ